jgi:hypothetical protein
LDAQVPGPPVAYEYYASVRTVDQCSHFRQWRIGAEGFSPGRLQ